MKLLSDHTPLTIDIMIIEEYIQTKKHTIIKNSEEEKNFLAELIESVKGLNTKYISSKENLERIDKSSLTIQKKFGSDT